MEEEAIVNREIQKGENGSEKNKRTKQCLDEKTGLQDFCSKCKKAIGSFKVRKYCNKIVIFKKGQTVKSDLHFLLNIIQDIYEYNYEE